MQTIQNNYSRGMYIILKDLDSASSSQAVCNSIVEGITKATGQKGCSLMLLTPDNKTLYHSAAFGLSDWFVKKGPVIADISISETLKGKSLAILHGPTDERIYYRKQIKEEGIYSILSAPVNLNGNTIGVVRVYSSEMYHFTVDDIAFVSMAANFGAAALENTGYFSTLQKDYEKFVGNMSQMRCELGFEGCAEPDVEPSTDKGPAIPFGG
jgi:signal transduction protein with GAF and PtsI domain